MIKKKHIVATVLFLIILNILSIKCLATNYFVSNAGADGNNGTSTATPWATIGKVNSFTFAPGDIISFNGGNTFIGPLTINQNGNSGNRITYNSYGTGQAIITGLTTLGAWTSLGGGLYEQVVSAAGTSVNMVVRDGSFQALGRYPNLGDNTGGRQNGYNIVSAQSGSTITSTQALPVSFVGGEAVIRPEHWILDRHPITAQAGNVITFSGGGYTPRTGFGYFIQNHPSATVLDVIGEWAYTSSSKKVTMFFGGGGPGASVVKVSTVANLVTAASKSFVTFDNLLFVGANNNMFTFTGSTNNIRIQNCGIYFTGVNVVDAVSTCNNNSVTGCTIDYTNNNCINAGTSPTWTVTGNTIRRTGSVAGMGGTGDGKYTCVYDVSTNSTLSSNNIFQTGYVALNYSSINGNGGGVVINRNFIDTFAFIKDDGAAIYSWGFTGASTTLQQRYIINNVILHGLGAGPGAGGTPASFGIYCDDLTANITLQGNSIAFVASAGIYLHNARLIEIHNNTTYNSLNVEVRSAQDNANGPMRNINMSGNIFFSLTTNTTTFQDFVLNFRSTFQDIAQWGTWDSNYYCRPLAVNAQGNPTPEALSMTARQCNNGTCMDFFNTVPNWRTFAAPKDQHSLATPITTTLANLRFEYNATNIAAVKSLGGNNYMDVRGVVYPGSITLQPYTSAVLMRTGASNSLPVVSAGANQTITLPTNSVSVTGTATDPDGSIVSRQWTKTIGGAATITSPTSATTTITGLVQGTYTFQFCATDNSGGSACAVMTVTVNPQPVVPPVSNAGPDRAIQLPVTTTTLNGSGTDADGTVVGYLWTKVSGPAAGTIVSSTQPVTNITGLTLVGTYIYNLRVTDNQGNVGSDQVTVTVVAANTPPTVTASANQTITLPTSSVTVSAVASDPGGSIASYAWTKISGPAGGTITTPSAASTTITGYTNSGTYIYQILVTDNQGLTATATTQITVQPVVPPNQPPVANAGADRVITLPTNSITQVGSATDADGTVTGYLWTKISGPATGTINTPTASTTVFSNLVQGTYIFQLRATDNLGATGTDQFTLTVNPVPNTPPIVNAGADKTITLPVTTSSLTGTATDPGGSIASVLWTQIGGTASTIVSPNSLTTNITGLTTVGSRTYKLLATDNLGLTASDTVIILVNAALIAPVSNAGTDKNITLPTNSVTQVGSGTDADGTIVGYLWTKVSGPAGGTIVSATQATTVINALQAGTYVYNLRVTDNSGLTANDQMTIVVNAANTPPTVSAGANQSITLPTSSVTLTATASDPGGSIVSYLWTKVSGPASGTITTPAASSTTVTGYTLPGTYVYQVLVTDNGGLTASATTQITVIAANIAPTANAGANQTIQLPTSSVTLSGSGTDPDGTIVAYAWVKISGPASGVITSPTSASTSVTGYTLAGTYVYRLTVTDNQGATGSATTQITVLASNVAPTVNAGANQSIQLPTSSVTLSGSATDPDGTIVSYLWTKVSGPATGTITTPSSQTTTVTGLTIAGTYVYRLTATDNNGASSSSTTQILVTAANIAPTANAGANQTITLPASQAILSGSGTDPDGTIVSYLWTKISGPASGTIQNPNVAMTIVQGYTLAGTYIYRLTVTDNQGLTGSSTTQITVQPAIPPNQPPVVNAGTDKVLTLPTNSVTQVGSATDPDGTIASYLWTKISGPATFTINSPTSSTTLLSGLVAGTYIFQLQATDNIGATGTDQATVVVNPAPNVPPTVNAGTDKVMTLPTNSVTQVGSATDPDGTITAYLWTKISGPATFTINSPTAATTLLSGLVAGTYVFQLMATDNQSATGTDQATIIVNPAPNVLPTVNAGTDKLLTLPTNSVTQVGSASDPDGTIVSYLWTLLSGPTTYTIGSPTSPSTLLSNLVQGTYVFQLAATDNSGGTGTDQATIQVDAAANVPPVANAGTDKTITLPTNSITQVGSGTDADGTITAYAWTKISGPSTFNIVTPAASTTVINNLVAGTYVFQLQVLDNSSASATDQMTVIVNPAPLVGPTANAGPDQVITLPISVATMAGSATDPDGTISSHTWSWLSGPAVATVTTPGSYTTTVTGLTVAGSYYFKLSVTDNDALTDTDTMIVLVNPAPNQPPVANAGTSQTTTTLQVVVNGAASTDPDGTIVGWLWTRFSGPTQYNIVSASQPVTVINGLIYGTYVFNLRVTDNSGATDDDTITIQVDSLNIPPSPQPTVPTANAGPDRHPIICVFCSSTSTVAIGSGTPGSYPIVSYQWTYVSGPSQYNINSPNTASTIIRSLKLGTYVFRLTVTDANGQTDSDDMTIEVRKNHLFFRNKKDVEEYYP